MESDGQQNRMDDIISDRKKKGGGGGGGGKTREGSAVNLKHVYVHNARISLYTTFWVDGKTRSREN
jgi:hypothetical protein